MGGIGLRECRKVVPMFLCSGMELMLYIHLHVLCTTPLVASITFRRWSRHTCNKYNFGVPSDHCSSILDLSGFTPKDGIQEIYHQY